MVRDVARRPARLAWGLFLLLLLVYNANGREIGTVDSQPQKFTAREVAVRGTLRLTRVIDERPSLARRAAFAEDRRGRYRSAYPVLPGVLAAVPAALLHWSGLVDMDAPLAPDLVAALTASVLTALAVVLVFQMLRRLVPERIAWWSAVGLGLGTGFWPLLSQTLWQHGPAALGFSLCLSCWIRRDADLSSRHLWLGGLGLGLAGAARPAVGLAVAVCLLWIVRRAGPRRACLAIAPVALLAAASVYGNVHWFGDPIGAYWLVESVHPEYHATNGTFAERPWESATGLLVSPSRGLLVYSPVVLVALAGLRTAWFQPRALGLRWVIAAGAVQFAAYCCYAVWWGGHTYGPRYMLDLLPLLMPCAAFGVARLGTGVVPRLAMATLLAWSVIVAGAGAFVYPHDRWNTGPVDVDRNHARLWDVRDTQIRRALTTEPSPQNFTLWSWDAVRQPSQAARTARSDTRWRPRYRVDLSKLKTLFYTVAPAPCAPDGRAMVPTNCLGWRPAPATTAVWRDLGQSDPEAP